MSRMKFYDCYTYSFGSLMINESGLVALLYRQWRLSEYWRPLFTHRSLRWTENVSWMAIGRCSTLRNSKTNENFTKSFMQDVDIETYSMLDLKSQNRYFGPSVVLLYRRRCKQALDNKWYG